MTTHCVQLEGGYPGILSQRKGGREGVGGEGSGRGEGSKVAPRLASRVPRNGSDAPRNAQQVVVGVSRVAVGCSGSGSTRRGPVMFNNVGHDAYWILVGINLIGLIVVVLFWPETKGISLEHMDRIFGEVDKVEAFKEEERRASMMSDAHGVLARDEKPSVSHQEQGSTRV